MRITKFILQALIISYGLVANAQVAINKDGSAPGAGSILHVKGDNSGNPVETMFIESSTGNIGIGTLTPGFKLTFKDVLGDKISLYGQSGNHFGFGIASYLLQIYSADTSSDIAFGYGSSSSFTELMRIKTNGQVGIGVTSPHSTASLEVSTTARGFLPPRMTDAQMESISNPAAGLCVFNTDVNGLCYFNGSNWNCLDKQSIADRIFLCGNTYHVVNADYHFKTVKIGSQCWMAENLNVGTKINSTTGGSNGDGNQTNNDTIEKYCYNDANTFCDTHGGLYQWNEMMQYITTAGTQGICPDGWHLPSDAEWNTLTTYLGGYMVAGGKLKDTIVWYSPNTGATNSSGFTAWPGGRLSSGKTFINQGDEGDWWTSTIHGTTGGYIRILHTDHAQVESYTFFKSVGASVRCVKN